VLETMVKKRQLRWSGHWQHTEDSRAKKDSWRKKKSRSAMHDMEGHISHHI